MVRLIAPIVCFVVGVIYLLLSLNLPISRIGDPQSPKYFPILIASLLIVMSIIYFFKCFVIKMCHSMNSKHF